MHSPGIYSFVTVHLLLENLLVVVLVTSVREFFNALHTCAWPPPRCDSSELLTNSSSWYKFLY
jgi:hypothetical protein